jgi:hypothetical protein
MMSGVQLECRHDRQMTLDTVTPFFCWRRLVTITVPAAAGTQAFNRGSAPEAAPAGLPAECASPGCRHCASEYCPTPGPWAAGVTSVTR